MNNSTNRERNEKARQAFLAALCYGADNDTHLSDLKSDITFLSLLTTKRYTEEVSIIPPWMELHDFIIQTLSKIATTAAQIRAQMGEADDGEDHRMNNINEDRDGQRL